MSNRIAAFTLMEFIVVLALIAVLSAVAIPSLQHLLAQARQTKQVNQLLAAIQYARSLAIERGEIVSLCGSSNMRSCDGIWSNGQIIIAQQSQQVLAVLDPVAEGAQLFWRSNLGVNDRLQLAANGFTHGQNGRFIYCPANADWQDIREIIVNQSGRARLSTKSSISTSICAKSGL